MKPSNLGELNKALIEIVRQRADYRMKVRTWVERLRSAIDRVAYFFRPEEMVFLLAVYDTISPEEIRKAEITDFYFSSTARETAFEPGYDHPGLQHVIAQKFDYLLEFSDTLDGIVSGGIFVALLDWDDDDLRGTSDRIRSLTAEEALALVVMLEVARALPHGIRTYDGWWTSRALLGMLERSSRENPWRDEGSNETIDFDGDSGLASEIATILRASEGSEEENGGTKEVDRES